MPHGVIKICSILLCTLVLGISLHAPARAASEEDQQTLEMFYESKDIVVSATRNPKPLSQTAENITVITAAEIEMMGAHTLVDVLANVSGIQASDRGGLGSTWDFSIQGANTTHILFLLDGVPLNFQTSQFVDIGMIPVQYIDHLEIIKGPASSSWGSALGGVVSIVTKSPNEEKKLGGTSSFSNGEHQTRDTRGELSGTLDRFGYYLYAGNLTSNGFRPNVGTDQNNFYTKLRWELPQQGSLQFTLAYDRGTAGDGDTSAYDFFSKLQRRYLLSTFSFSYPLSANTDLDISYRTTLKKTIDSGNILSSGDPLPDITSHEWSSGGSAKLTWRGGIHNLVAGAEFDHLKLQADPNQVGISQDFYSDKYGLFISDTLTLGSLALTPSIRYDQMRPTGDFISPSLGAAWSLNEQTILRAYAARGYSLPLLFSNTTQEKVDTIQGGVETTQIPYVWLKTTLFLNYLSDVQAFDANFNVVLQKQKIQGFEVEMKTVPLLNTSLSAGYNFIDAKNRDTGEILPNVPRQILKMGLHYNDRRSLKAALLGRYVWFDASPERNARDNAIIWDLSLAKQVLIGHDILTIPGSKLEIFFTGHNIFNGAQYSADYAKNAPRWLEGGIRFNF